MSKPPGLRTLVLHLKHQEEITDCPNSGWEWSVPIPEFQHGLISIPTLLCSGGCDSEVVIVRRVWTER